MSFFLLALTFAVGMGVVAYPTYAAQKGWPRGQQYTEKTSIVQMLGFFGWISVAVMSFVVFDLLAAFAVILVGFFGAFALVGFLGSKFQWLGLLTTPMVIISAFYLRVF